MSKIISFDIKSGRKKLSTKSLMKFSWSIFMNFIQILLLVLKEKTWNICR